MERDGFNLEFILGVGSWDRGPVSGLGVKVFVFGLHLTCAAQLGQVMWLHLVFILEFQNKDSSSFYFGISR